MQNATNVRRQGKQQEAKRNIQTSTTEKQISANNSLFKKYGKEVLIYRVVPLRHKDGEFFISIISFRAYKQKGKKYLANRGGYRTRFRYDCDTEKLVLIEEKVTHNDK